MLQLQKKAIGAYQEKIRSNKTAIAGIGVEDEISCSPCPSSGDSDRIIWALTRLESPACSALKPEAHKVS